jgi:hypothetical protein
MKNSDISTGDLVWINKKTTRGPYAGRLGRVIRSDEWTATVSIEREPGTIAEAIRLNESGDNPSTAYLFGRPVLTPVWP